MMKKAILPGRGQRLKQSVLGAITLGVATALLPQRAVAEAVDSELLLLVDSTSRGMGKSEFESLMNGYADAITSTQVVDSIQSGTYGRIAISLMFFGDATSQTVGIPWMSIGNAAEAETFAILLRAMSHPRSSGTIEIDAALLAAISTFGTETGAASNSFESVVQLVEVVAASTPAGGSTAGVAAARDQALASGVEVINALAVGNKADLLETYYASNVIGGEAGGVAAASGSSALDGSLTGFLTNQVSGHVAAGAAESLALVPEPSSVVALVSGFGLLLLRRRRP